MMSERVVLVDEGDAPIGTEEKLRAHVEGRLHRAFSVFILNGRDELLLQRRARDKYHSGGLWSNACCSHPRPGETVAEAAARRLGEELGLACELMPAFAFRYHVRVGNGLFEHEYDHVLIGRHDGPPAPDAAEVETWRWAGIDEVLAERARDPDAFTPWFGLALDGLLARGLLPATERI